MNRLFPILAILTALLAAEVAGAQYVAGPYGGNRNGQGGYATSHSDPYGGNRNGQGGYATSYSDPYGGNRNGQGGYAVSGYGYSDFGSNRIGQGGYVIGFNPQSAAGANRTGQGGLSNTTVGNPGMMYFVPSSTTNPVPPTGPSY